MMERSICVFCGSRSGEDPEYWATAEELGKRIAALHWRLVYGAGDIGLMGAVANACQKAGGKTFGVIPTHLLDLEVGKTDLSQFVVTENMHERKKVMFMNCDAIIVLPGGAGSLDEFFEVLTWRQLGLHEKPIIVMNTNGFWSPLMGLIDHIIGKGFAEATLRDFVHVAENVDDAEAALVSALS